MEEKCDVTMLALNQISTEGVQTRSGVRQPVVDEYAKMLEEGETFDPAVVFDDGRKLYLAAGHHRYHAHRQAGKLEMPCIVKKGSKWDALVFGCQDNLKHRGTLFTRADKRMGVSMLLREQPQQSDSAIAKLTRVTPKTVASIRAELETTMEIPKSVVRRGADGREYNTQNLRSSPASNHQSPPTGPEVDNEFCSCGGRWVSDGEGGRFCEECYADFPECDGGEPGAMEEPPVADYEDGSDDGIDRLTEEDWRCPSEDGLAIPLLQQAVLEAFEGLVTTADRLGRLRRNPAVQAKLSELEGLLQAWATAV